MHLALGVRASPPPNADCGAGTEPLSIPRRTLGEPAERHRLGFDNHQISSRQTRAIAEGCWPIERKSEAVTLSQGIRVLPNRHFYCASKHPHLLVPGRWLASGHVRKRDV